MDKITKSNFLSHGPFIPVYSHWFNELVDEVNAITTGTALDVAYEASVGVTDPMIDLDADVVGVAYKAINVDIDVTTTGLTADAVYGSYFDLTGLATDNDTSTITGAFIQTNAVASGRADNTGIIISLTGTRDTADTDNGIIIGMTQTMSGGASAYGIRVSTASLTHTNGSLYGYYLAMTQAVTAGSAYGLYMLCNNTGSVNSKYGIYIQKNLTNSTAVGALAQTNYALKIDQETATSATASGASTSSNDTVYLYVTNTTSIASADVYSGKVLSIVYSASTTGAGTATNDAHAIHVQYVTTETAGTLSLTATDVVNFTWNTAGHPAVASGNYNIVAIAYSNGGVSPAYAATSYVNGLNVDMSAVVVTDADLILTGVSVTLPALGTSQTIGVSATNGTQTAGLLYNSATVYASDGVQSVALANTIDAVVYVGRLRSGYTIGDGLASAYNNVKTLKYTIGINGVADCDYNFSTDADQDEESKQLGVGTIIPARSRIIDVIVYCEASLVGGTATVDVGISSGSNEFISAGNCDGVGECVGMTAGSAPFAAALYATAGSVYFSVDPSANWNTLSLGKWTVFITYIDNLSTAVN